MYMSLSVSSRTKLCSTGEVCETESYLMAGGAVFSLIKTKPSLFQYASTLRFFSSQVSSQLQFESVGFVGLGNMGSRMANNLIKAGYNVAVHDKNSNVMKLFSDKGVPTKQTPFEVAEASDVIITMLPSSSHVLDVYTGPNGMLHQGNLLRPHLLIDSSTIDPQTSRKLSLAVSSCTLKEKKGYFEKPVMLDAPVSGGVLAAEAGTLTFMVGGSEDAYLAAKPLFLSMGRNAIYCGGAGNGSAAKICNNLAMGVSMAGVSEALALGQSLGITATALTRILNSSSARCWSSTVQDEKICTILRVILTLVLVVFAAQMFYEKEMTQHGSDTYNPVPGVMEGVPASKNYDGGFATKFMAKDLNFATASANEVDLTCPLASQARDIYTELCKEGHDSEDFSCIFRYYYSGKDEV
uniref:3-hydroxyisobutyrate dehydrogenase n=2 Tax=Rhizophora mucronata TaxID=61149 RepID=A0A2P2JKL0_RHIMU